MHLMNKRTINEIYKLRNNKMNIKKLGTTIKDLGTVLGMGTKIGTLGKLQFRIKMKELRIRNKN